MQYFDPDLVAEVCDADDGVDRHDDEDDEEGVEHGDERVGQRGGDALELGEAGEDLEDAEDADDAEEAEDGDGHRDVERPHDVIPGEFYTTVSVAAPILAQFFVLILYCCDQMIDILFPFVFYSKIIDDEGERNRTGSVFPKSRSVLALVITVGCKAFPKKFVGKDSGLG